jgi:hypothetical protein
MSTNRKKIPSDPAIFSPRNKILILLYEYVVSKVMQKKLQIPWQNSTTLCFQNKISGHIAS